MISPGPKTKFSPYEYFNQPANMIMLDVVHSLRDNIMTKITYCRAHGL